MKRTPVNSSHLASVGYDPASRTMEVEFSHGAVYQYFDIPESEYQELMQAGSHGSYFNANIRGAFRYMRL